MKNKMSGKAGGFTLIELLVIVLIIGILAAVAVPQYQKAVEKSRAVQLVTIAKAVTEAEENYFMANGEYTTDWDVLNMSFKGSQISQGKWVIDSKKGLYALLTINAGDTNFTPNGVRVFPDWEGRFHLWWGYAHNTGGWKNHRACYAALGNKKYNQICQYLTGKKEPYGSTPSYDTYSF